VLFKFNKPNSPRTPRRSWTRLSVGDRMPRYILEVEGFTDKSGDAEYNLALSRKRADTVVRYLVDHNVPLRRIHTIGWVRIRSRRRRHAPADKKSSVV